MMSAAVCAGVALGVMLLTVGTNSLRPANRRVLPLDQLWMLAGGALLNLLVCLVYAWWTRPKRGAAPRVLIVGCGAVGSVVGLHLARGGAHVAFLVREDRADSLVGLRLERLALCSCSKGSDAMIKQVEWVGFDLLTNVADCCGPVRLRSDPANQQPKPFNVVILAVPAAAARAASPVLKQLVEGLGRNCAVVRVVSDLGEDRFFHDSLGAHHTQLVDMGIGFMSYASPLENRGRSGAADEAFGYITPSKMLLSGVHPMVDRLVEVLNTSELPAARAPSVGAALAVPSAALLGLVASLEHVEWKLARFKDAEELATLCQSMGEAIDIVTSSTEGERLQHARGWCRCGCSTRIARWLISSPCVVRLALYLVTCSCAPHLMLPFDLELFLTQHFSKLGVSTTRPPKTHFTHLTLSRARLLSLRCVTVAGGWPDAAVPRGVHRRCAGTQASGGRTTQTCGSTAQAAATTRRHGLRHFWQPPAPSRRELCQPRQEKIPRGQVWGDQG